MLTDFVIRAGELLGNHAGTPSKRYRFNGQVVAQRSNLTDVYFNLNDHLGGVAATFGATGGVTVVRRDAWGKERSKSGTLPVGNYLYTGQRWDELLGLYDYNARYYDAELGRFLSSDSMVPDVASQQSFNRFSYVRNSPVMRVDPSGHQDDLQEGMGGGGGTTIIGTASPAGQAGAAGAAAGAGAMANALAQAMAPLFSYAVTWIKVVTVTGVIIWLAGELTEGGSRPKGVEYKRSPTHNGKDLAEARAKGGKRTKADDAALEGSTDEYFKEVYGVDPKANPDEGNTVGHGAADRIIDFGNGNEKVEYKHPTAAKVAKDSGSSAVKDSVKKANDQGADAVVVDLQGTDATVDGVENGLDRVTQDDLGPSTKRVIVLIDGPDGTTIEISREYP